ncbi:MAG: DUF3341 domain-containing protein [Chloroflexi bacterium]|nr:DUF3341 domain-containing protein [Chloroflexota bacterium]
MFKDQVLGLCRNPETAAQAVEALENKGFSAEEYDILTATPYPEGTFGESRHRHRLYVFPFVGAVLGLSVAVLITVGTQIFPPIVTGGKPILSIPPMIIIMFEGTMLGAILFTVIGVIFESRLFGPKLGLYDRRITEGYIGLLVTSSPERVTQAEEAMTGAGVQEFKRLPAGAGGR